MATDDDDQLADPKVKDFLDAATRADLERWFNLPSFEVAAENAPPPPPEEDPDIVRIREQRAKAMAAVDPALLEALHQRYEGQSDSLIHFTASLTIHADPDIALFDQRMVERQSLIAEPREVEISEELRDDLKDCTPQAILRDLHRPELDFEKTFEMIDPAADMKLDIVAEVATAMATSWKLPQLEELPFREGRKLIAEVVALLRSPWPALVLSRTLPNRRVTE